MTTRVAIATVWFTSLAVMGGMDRSVSAAERLSIRLGPVQQSVKVSDLKHFATTGEVPPALRLYAPVLTSDIQVALNSYLPFDPAVSDDLVADLLQSSTGEKIFEALELAIPQSNPEKIETALKHASQNPNGLSVLGFMAAYPDDTLMVDASAAVTLTSQFNLPHWQRGLLNSVLERELTIESSLDRLPFDPTARGYARVQQETLTLHDPERDRAIPVDLYWSEWSSGPLVVISHGFAADRRFLHYLAEHLSSHGLAVAAIEHPSSNVAWLSSMALGVKGGGRLSDILPITEFLDRPRDISVLLDELERQNEGIEQEPNAQKPGQKADRDRPSFSLDEVTVIGHSLGGYTALALAGAEVNMAALRQFCGEHSVMELAPADWLQCRAVDLPEETIALRDTRVTQVIALNPVMARIFGESGLAKITVPTLITAASEDAVTPAVSQQLLPFTHFRNETRYLLTAIGATHLSMGDPSNLNPTLATSIMLRERSWSETEQMRALLQGLSLAFIKQQTPEADLYAPFLSPTYVQSWSNERIQLRLSSALPPKLEQWLRMAAWPMEQVVAATLPKKKSPSEERSLYAGVLRWLSNGVILMLFIPPTGLSLPSIRDMHKQWQRPRRSHRLNTKRK